MLPYLGYYMLFTPDQEIMAKFTWDVVVTE